MQYAELHCLTNFSFLEAASHPDELAVRAAELGYSALAITDRSSLAGVVRANTAAKDHSLKLIIGSEIRPLDAPPVVLWVKDRTGYGHLCRLITLGRRRAAKGECRIRLEDIAAYSDGLVGGSRAAARLRATFRRPTCSDTETSLERRATCWPNCTKVRTTMIELAWLEDLSRKTGLPLVAAGNVLFHIPARKVLHDVLTAIRLHTTVALAGDWLLPNAQRHLRPLDELRATFAGMPQALRRTMEVADQCSFSLDELRYEYPEELAPAGLVADAIPAATHLGRGQAAISPGPARSYSPTLGTRIEADRGTPLRAVFSDCMGFGPIRPLPKHLVPGTRIGRQFRRLLLSGHHGRRSRAHRHAVRAVHQPGTRRSARHRHRFRARTPGRGVAVHL